MASVTRTFRWSFAAAAVVAGLYATAAAQGPERPDHVERPFQKGGRIAMDLSAGGYTIRGSAIDSIRVRWRTENPRDMNSVVADVKATGQNASIRTRGPKNNFRVQIDVPAVSDLYIDLSAGEIDLEGVEGTKRVSMWAGEVRMAVGDPQLYGQVDVTVRAGDINARAFGGNRGGLFRSYRWNGPGKHSITAKLFAGEVTLVK